MPRRHQNDNSKNGNDSGNMAAAAPARRELREKKRSSYKKQLVRLSGEENEGLRRRRSRAEINLLFLQHFLISVLTHSIS